MGCTARRHTHKSLSDFPSHSAALSRAGERILFSLPQARFMVTLLNQIDCVRDKNSIRCEIWTAFRHFHYRGFRSMVEELPQTTECLNRIRAGDAAALAEVFHSYRVQLRQMVELRLD